MVKANRDLPTKTFIDKEIELDCFIDKYATNIDNNCLIDKSMVNDARQFNILDHVSNFAQIGRTYSKDSK